MHGFFTRRKRPGTRAGVAFGAMLAAALIVAACGGSRSPGVASLAGSSAAATATPTGTPMTPQQAALAYAQCMRDHGVTKFPDPTFGSGGGITMQVGSGVDPNSQTFKSAQTTCQPLMRAGEQAGGGKPMTPAQQQAFLNFAQCMRDHGIPMQDPTFTGGGVQMRVAAGSGGTLDKNSPALQAAQQACSHFIATLGPAKGVGG